MENNQLRNRNEDEETSQALLDRSLEKSHRREPKGHKKDNKKKKRKKAKKKDDSDSDDSNHSEMGPPKAKLGWICEGFLGGRAKWNPFMVSNYKNIVDSVTAVLVLSFLAVGVTTYEPSTAEALNPYFLVVTALLLANSLLSFIDAYFLLKANFESRESNVTILSILNFCVFSLIQILAITVKPIPWIRENLIFLNLTFIAFQFGIYVWFMVSWDYGKQFLERRSGTGQYCGLLAFVTFLTIDLIYTKALYPIKYDWVIVVFTIPLEFLASVVVCIGLLGYGTYLFFKKKGAQVFFGGLIMIVVSLLDFTILLDFIFLDEFQKVGEYKIFTLIVLGLLLLLTIVWMIFTVRFKRTVQDSLTRAKILKYENEVQAANGDSPKLNFLIQFLVNLFDHLIEGLIQKILPGFFQAWNDQDIIKRSERGDWEEYVEKVDKEVTSV